MHDVFSFQISKENNRRLRRAMFAWKQETGRPASEFIEELLIKQLDIEENKVFPEPFNFLKDDK